ncbi:hypothetical protein D3C71_1770210 [compost metagenome]
MPEPHEESERNAAHQNRISTSNELRIDLRALTAPEPMHRILGALQTLRHDQQLVALTPFPPLHLLPILDRWGFAYRVDELPGGSGSITIWSPGIAADRLATAQ